MAATGNLPQARDGDCFLMRQILHDWNDQDARLILRNVRQAMGGARATLAIVEVRPCLPVVIAIHGTFSSYQSLPPSPHLRSMPVTYSSSTPSLPSKSPTSAARAPKVSGWGPKS